MTGVFTLSVKLSEIFKELDSRDCHVMLSNSNTELIKQLYKGYNIQEIAANRAINCKSDRRKKGFYEVIVKN
jgi:DNA adenine methylase